MFTFHAFSSRLSPGFVSLCPFPTKLHSFYKSKHSSDRNGSTRGFCLLTLFTAYLTSPGLLLITTGAEDDWKTKLFGVLFGILLTPLEKLLDVRDTTRIFFQGQEPVALSLLLEPYLPLPKPPSALRPPCCIRLFPCGFAAPSLSKEGNTTKLENKPTIATTETPNK